jgi:lipopolysaccharide transport system ATP-binding protein
MSDIAIKVEGLFKSYQIRKGLQKEGRYTALRDVLTDGAHHFFKNVRQGKNPFNEPDQTETFWALKDINFEVNQGEVLGVIGRNGAGKSTLLKILSRITEPDKGRITLNGRVSSLLEVGTGFHPELTGRENIYLCGAILGMKRAEIKKVFDEIVTFAGVEKFLEMPVKRYSSGMYVRLGFAMAAHLETEILFVDEVLAVGDVEFQKKCIEKMKSIAARGNALLFVSHNLDIVKRLCPNSILLHSGEIMFQGSSNQALEHYNKIRLTTHYGSFNIRKVQFMVNGRDSLLCKIGDKAMVKVFFEFEEPLINPVLGVVLKNEFHNSVFGINNKHYNTFFNNKLRKGNVTFEILDFPPLTSGYYYIDIYLGDIYGDKECFNGAVEFYFESTHFDFGPQKRLNTVIIEKVNWFINEEF